MERIPTLIHVQVQLQFVLLRNTILLILLYCGWKKFSTLHFETLEIMGKTWKVNWCRIPQPSTVPLSRVVFSTTASRPRKANVIHTCELWCLHPRLRKTDWLFEDASTWKTPILENVSGEILTTSLFSLTGNEKGIIPFYGLSELL